MAATYGFYSSTNGGPEKYSADRLIVFEVSLPMVSSSTSARPRFLVDETTMLPRGSFKIIAGGEPGLWIRGLTTARTSGLNSMVRYVYDRIDATLSRSTRTPQSDDPSSRRSRELPSKSPQRPALYNSNVEAVPTAYV